MKILTALGLLFALSALARAEDIAARYKMRGIFGKSAVVEESASGKQTVVRVGDSLEDYKIESVTARSIVLVRDGQKVELQLIDATPPGVEPAPPTEGAAPPPETRGETREGVTLIGFAGRSAIFEVSPEGASIMVRVGESLGAGAKLLELAQKSAVIERDGERVELGLGGFFATSGLAVKTAEEPAAEPTNVDWLYLGRIAEKAILEVAGATEHRQITVAAGEEIRPGLFLIEHDGESATVEERGVPNSRRQLLRTSSRRESTSAERGASIPGIQAPPYPLRQPLWERHLARTLEETRVTINLTARDLDEVMLRLREDHGLPVCLDPDAIESLSDADFTVTLAAFDLPAKEVLDQLVSGRPLIVELAFGCIMVGLPRNLEPLRRQRAGRDTILREMETVRAAVRSIPEKSEGVLEDLMEDRLRFEPMEAPGEIRTLGGLVRMIAGVLQVTVTFTATTVDGKSVEEIAIAAPVGRKSMRDHLIAGLGDTGLTYRWNGNVLRIMTTDEGTNLDAREHMREVEIDKRHSELFDLPRDEALGIDEPITGHIWRIVAATQQAGLIELHADEASWRRSDIEIALPKAATLGDLISALAAAPSAMLVRGPTGRILLLSF